MGQKTTPTDVARKLTDEVVAGAAGIEAFVVISSVDLEIAKERRKRGPLSRRQLVNRTRAIPDAYEFCAAVKDGGLAAARAIADSVSGEPRCVWWCEARAECEGVVAGIYERLRRSHRPYDAYDLGVCGPLAWVVLWRD
jgi:hypothetical protein